MRHEPLVVIEGTKRDNRFAPSNAHGHLKRNRLCESLHCKCRRRPGQPFSASLRSRNAHGHVCHKSNFRREFQGKKAEPKIVKTPHRRVCESAAEMHMGNSKNAGDQRVYPDPTSAFTLTGRTPRCGHTVWGKM